ncbi:MAG: NTP transferase domain-containing protein [Nitriliruptorales bacterium]|nr:NTP transferase domain-containing protein [Nitriliruptorales bacterium]
MTGLVLAGGASSRMGRDKATLRSDGGRLVDLAVSALRDVCERVLIAAGERVIADVAAECIPDAEGEGPLAGIVSGLRAADTPLVAVLAVDMPYASAEVFRRLAGAWQGEAGVAAAVDGSLQPLHAVYATSQREQYAELLAAGERSPRRALVLLGARVIDAAVWGDIGPAFAHNVNSPADLSSLRAPTERR